MHKAKPSEKKLRYDWRKVQKWWRNLVRPSPEQLVVAADFSEPSESSDNET
jgi:hypothetical protein